MSYKKPQPLFQRLTHEPCPVCGEISYSLTGVHPQCAVKQADAERVERITREKKAKQAQKPADDLNVWQKRCPKCRALQHVRKKTCECGHALAHHARPPNATRDAS